MAAADCGKARRDMSNKSNGLVPALCSARLRATRERRGFGPHENEHGASTDTILNTRASTGRARTERRRARSEHGHGGLGAALAMSLHEELAP